MMLRPRRELLPRRRVGLETDSLSVFEKKAWLGCAPVVRTIEACFGFSKRACFCPKGWRYV